MRIRNDESYQQKKIDIMEKCYECYAEHGLFGVGIKAVAKYCGYSAANLYTYFEDLDDLIIQSTEYCMSKVEDDFMAKAPKSAAEVPGYIDEIPYWTAENHGKKYRLMYQVYAHPKYREHGKKFFEGVDKRYTEYAQFLAPALGIPAEVLTPMIFTLIRASVHYALFEDEFYMKAQLALLKKGVQAFTNPEIAKLLTD